MSATRSGLGIRPRRAKASATRCWSAVVAADSGVTGERGRRCKNRLTTPASKPLKAADQLDGFRAVLLHQLVGLGEFFKQGDHGATVLGRKVFGGQVKRVVARQAAPGGQDARLDGQLGGGKERVPNAPGVYALAFERSAGICWRQVNGLNVRPLQARLLNRPHHQVVRAGALLQATFLPFKSARVLSGESRSTKMAELSGLGGSAPT